MKKALLALAVAGAAVSAQADTKLYGHVAYSLRDLDSSSDVDVDRNGFTESRFGFSFSKKLKNGLTALAIQEFGLGDTTTERGNTTNNGTVSVANGTGDVVAANGSSNSAGSVSTRRNAFGFKGDFGKVLLGQYNDVGDGAINADLAGTNIVNALSSNSAGVVGLGANGFDPGRGEALRYYSPKIGGVATVAAQYQENGGNEVVVKVNAAGFRFNAFLEDAGTETSYDERSGFLIGYKAPIGLSFTYVSSESETGATTAEQDGWKIGYATGKHKVSISATEIDGLNESKGVSYLYNMAKGVQLWAGYKTVDNNAGVEVDSGTAIGGRVKF
jgi:predicted porin